MDTHLQAFPIVSYVMSRIQLSPNTGAETPCSVDVERPLLPNQVELVERMPCLRNPELITSMLQAISDVEKTRSVIRNLGERPNHEAVDDPRKRINEIDVTLASDIESSGVDGTKETQGQKRADRERSAYRAVVRLDEMHAEYENLLRSVEERLVRMYRSAESNVTKSEGSGNEEMSEQEQADEKVIKVLQEASGSGAERVELKGRGLRYLPEAFGRLRGLLVLNLGNNKLEVRSIASLFCIYGFRRVSPILRMFSFVGEVSGSMS